MKLKLKTFLVVSVTMLLFLTLLILAIRPFLLRDSNKLDQNSTYADVKRVKNDLESDLAHLNSINRDWAIWDDTYLFLDNQYPDYLRKNISNATMENIGINFMVFINKNHEVIYQRAYDLNRKKSIDIDIDFYKAFLPAVHDTNDLNRAFFLKVDDRMTMTSIQPVYQSDREGTSPGWLIMGKWFNERAVDDLGKKLSLNLYFKQSNLTNKHMQIQVQPVSESNIKGSLSIKEYSEQKYYEISILNKRSFYLQKMANIKQITIYLIISTLTLIVLMNILLSRLVTSRVRDLSLQLGEIQTNKDIKTRVRISKGKDELSSLENSINNMLASLEEKHESVTQLAFYDQLTMLPNRYKLFKEFFDRTIGKKEELVIFFFDLDGFKWVNDSMGHTIGDMLLVNVCKRVSPVVEEQDGMLARYGGDEFVILLPNTGRAEIERIAENIMLEINRVFQIHSFKISVTASIGISSYPQDSTTIEPLLQKADIAMYEAKRKGKNQYIFYHDLNNTNNYKNLLELEKDLKYALIQKQLESYYQIIVDSEHHQITGVEALLRWNHPTKGVIPPAKFIPIAEETGIMPYIGLWILEDAVKQAKKWHLQGHDYLSISVNISKSQMKDHSFINKLDKVLEEYDFPPSKLQIEITESDINHYLKEIKDFTIELKKRNIKIALDDFGVGTSSLIYLKELPIDVIKIDRSFIRDVPLEPFDTTLLSGILEIIHDLQLDVIVEGIETKEQSEFIHSQFSAKLQGYYFSRPIPASEIEQIFLFPNQNIGQII
ncbi:EAL domain-containing protein [Neobacillus sp. LXY-1]|uniref:EAL domain-containing protein n=1 Tax=Neobacillus sp. LXY-1 TaxID=3379133 RepID=UPI003EE28EB4